MKANPKDLKAGANDLLNAIRSISDKACGDFAFGVNLDSLDERQFFLGLNHIPRFYYESRDQKFKIYGIGVAYRMLSFGEVEKKRATLLDGQCFVGGARFAKSQKQEPQWQAFQQEQFVLPLVHAICQDKTIKLFVNYRADGEIPFSVWLDHAQNILLNLSNHSTVPRETIRGDEYQVFPSYERHREIVNHALELFRAGQDPKKVVVARQNIIQVSQHVDPIDIFLALKSTGTHAHRFYFEPTGEGAFFGASPELLFRKQEGRIYTESVAGTLAKSGDDEADKRQLLDNIKEQHEHGLVSDFIEEKLKSLGVTDLDSSESSVVSLSYVHHIVKRYVGDLPDNLSDVAIIDSLHPTPAVCGTPRDWAMRFIEENEGFDRGFFCGPIGVITRDISEFCVAIRSALFHDKKLLVYAGSGIVQGSNSAREWDELTNKQKNIMATLNWVD